MPNINDTRIKNLGILCEKIINGEIEFFQSRIMEQYDFEKAITRFKKIKEQAVKKSMIDSVNFQLHFNVNKSKELLWDIIFLGKYIDSKINNQEEKDEILNRINTVILEEIKAFSEKTSSLENSFDELKKSVVIFQKVRDALSHNQNGNVYSFNIIDKTININAVHQNNKLTCEIPLEYINSIGLGIKPLPNDKQIANEVNELVSIISFHQGYTIEDLPSLFYRMSPNHLSYILGKSNNDLKVVEKLPISLFTCNIDILKYLTEDIGLSIDDIKNSKTELLNCSLQRLVYLYNIYGSIDKINELNGYLFNCDENILSYILKVYGNNNINILSEKVFSADIHRLIKLNEICNFDIKKLNQLNDAMFKCPNINLDYLLHTIGIEEMNKLKYSFYFIPIENMEFFIKNVKESEKINQLNESVLKGSFDNLTKVFNKVNHNIDKFIVLLNKIFEKEENIDNFLKYDLNILLELDNYIYRGNKEIIDFLLTYKGNNLLELKKIPPGCFICSLDKLKLLLSQVNYDFNQFYDLNPYIFNASIERVMEILNTKNENIINDRCDTLIELFEDDLFDMETVNIILENSDLFSIAIPQGEKNRDKLNNSINILYFDTSACNYLHNICNLSYKEICELLKNNKNLIQMDIVDVKKLLTLSNGDLEIMKYANYSMLKCDKQRFDYIMKKSRNDYKRLEEIPIELFEVEDEVFYSMYDLYEFNKLKSFMKTDNTKLIAMIIYLNQFFSTYKNEIDTLNYSDILDTTMFNITTLSPVLKDLSNSLNSSLEKSFSSSTFDVLKAINVSNKSSEKYLNTVTRVLDKMKNLESNLYSENKNIITCIRNCGEHMKVFEDPNDTDSVILEDSIVRNGVKDVTFKATVKYIDLIRFIKNLENDIKDASYSKSVQHKSELTDSTLYNRKKEEYFEIRNLIVKKYLALDYLNRIGIVDVKEIVINDQIYYIYEESGNIIKTKIDDLALLHQSLDIVDKETIQNILTPRTLK